MSRIIVAVGRLAVGVSALCLAVAGWAQSSANAPIDLQARFKEAQADPAQNEALTKLGRKTALFCANCHGEGGNSVVSNTPNLAGQNPAYLLEQVRQFSEGRRKNEFMQGLLRALNNDEKVGVALYFAKQTVQHKPAADPAQAELGRKYYHKICFRCHGTNGHGDEKIARIAGQQTEYLTTTLKRYRDGSAVRMNPDMAANTRSMSDADVAAVVAYISQMK